MDPKLYLLFALFSTIAIAASHRNLREFARKLHFSQKLKDDFQSQA